MCIRDRLEAKGKLIRKALGISELSIEILEDRVAFPWFEELPDSAAAKAYTPVSYTHLDVYKSQGCVCEHLRVAQSAGNRKASGTVLRQRG